MSRPNHLAAALASGLMVAGMVPELPSQETTRLARAKGLPLGAQLSTWKRREIEALAERKMLRKHNRERRGVTWLKWKIGWERKGGRHQATHTTHRDRAQLCAAHGVANSGRQWRKLRKTLARRDRAA